MSLVVCVATNCETVDLLGQGQRRNDPDGEPETEGIGILSAILGSVKGRDTLWAGEQFER